MPATIPRPFQIPIAIRSQSTGTSARAAPAGGARSAQRAPAHEARSRAARAALRARPRPCRPRPGGRGSARPSGAAGDGNANGGTSGKRSARAGEVRVDRRPRRPTPASPHRTPGGGPRSCSADVGEHACAASSSSRRARSATPRGLIPRNLRNWETSLERSTSVPTSTATTIPARPAARASERPLRRHATSACRECAEPEPEHSGDRAREHQAEPRRRLPPRAYPAPLSARDRPERDRGERERERHRRRAPRSRAVRGTRAHARRRACARPRSRRSRRRTGAGRSRARRRLQTVTDATSSSRSRRVRTISSQRPGAISAYSSELERGDGVLAEQVGGVARGAVGDRDRDDDEEARRRRSRRSVPRAAARSPPRSPAQSPATATTASAARSARFACAPRTVTPGRKWVCRKRSGTASASTIAPGEGSRLSCGRGVKSRHYTGRPDAEAASLAPLGHGARDLRLHRARHPRVDRRAPDSRPDLGRALQPRDRHGGVLPAAARADRRRGAREVRLPLRGAGGLGTLPPARAGHLRARGGRRARRRR